VAGQVLVGHGGRRAPPPDAVDRLGRAA
jgi:hypothetical protein